MVGSTGISDKIMKKMESIVDSEKKLKMIIELLETEQRYVHKSPSHKVIKKDFQIVLDNHFPLPPEKDTHE